MPIVRPSSLWYSVKKLHLNDKITNSCLKKYVSLASYQTFQTTKMKFEEHLRSISITGSVVFAKLAMTSLAATKSARIPDACPKICTVELPVSDQQKAKSRTAWGLKFGQVYFSDRIHCMQFFRLQNMYTRLVSSSSSRALSSVVHAANKKITETIASGGSLTEVWYNSTIV